MASSEVEIANLVYRYAEYIDGGDFEAAADLFAHARSTAAGGSPTATTACTTCPAT